MSPPCAAFSLDNLIDDIHVWVSNLDQPDEVIQREFKRLGRDVRECLSRYRVSEIRDRQTIAKSALFSILAAYLKEDISNLQLESDYFGKPSIARGRFPAVPEFSVSHSGPIAMFAFTRDGAIGVDVERIVDLPELADMVSFCFSEYERRWFGILPREIQERCFFEVWTIKEAYLKAIGKGMALSPASVEVDFKQEQGYGFHRVPQGSPDRWNVFSFEPQTGFVAAVVAERNTGSLHHFSWEPTRIRADAQ